MAEHLEGDARCACPELLKAAHVTKLPASNASSAASDRSGQDERPQIYQDMLAGLAGTGETGLVEWMQRYNDHRQR